MSTAILNEIGPACRDERRRALLLEHRHLGLNGIDFVEYRYVGNEHMLDVHFFADLPEDAYGLADDPQRVRIEGGTRIVGIEAMAALRRQDRPNVLTFTINAQGDFSTHYLTLGWRSTPTGWSFHLPGVDRLFSVAPVNFRAGCPVPFDCAPVDECRTEALPEPMLDYLAKDYASFRRLLLDLVAQRNPRWIENSPADLGVALLELLAYEGDQLSYFQDAVANEMFLDTVRQRVSAKRHARLVDYRMHDGRNAWTHVHFRVTEGGDIPAGTQLVTRITAPLRGAAAPPSVEVEIPGELFDSDPVLLRSRVFETAAALATHPRNNEIRIHSWGNEACCIPAGGTTAHLFSVDEAMQTAVRPFLMPGDLLLLEEVRGPETGAAADADPLHRVVVQIEEVAEVDDPLFRSRLAAGALRVRTANADPLPLLEVTWRALDALPFSLCLTNRRSDGSVIDGITVARGNIVAADHGRTVIETLRFDPPLDAAENFVLPIERAPITLHCRPASESGAAVARLDGEVSTARPAVELGVTSVNGEQETWTAVPDLLDSDVFHPHFVVDLDAAGRPSLRFGADGYGKRPSGVRSIDARIRVGNGSSGNVAAGALAHVVRPPAGASWPWVEAVRNPIAARDGTDAENIEEVRQYAPAAFRARQLRAVTEADYRDAALTIDGVAGAMAGFRWTGSWYTVLVAIDPHRPDDLINDPGGRTRLAESLRRRVHQGLSRYRLAGYDLEIVAARYVPLQIELDLCIRPGYFRADVGYAVARALGPRADRTGRPGLFSPDNLSFGEPVYASRIYAAVEAIEGVDSAVLRMFQRQGVRPSGELESGELPIGPWEIARLDNDPNHVENGVLTIHAMGGK